MVDNHLARAVSVDEYQRWGPLAISVRFRVLRNSRNPNLRRADRGDLR